MIDEIHLDFEDDYAQMLRDMFDWPGYDHPNPPEGYTPIEIEPEDSSDLVPERSHALKLATWKSTDGRKLVTEMDDFHLANTIRFLQRTDYPNNRDMLKLMLEEREIRTYEEANH